MAHVAVQAHLIFFVRPYVMIIPRAQLLPIHVEAKEPRHDKPILAIIVLITSSSKSQNVSKFSNSDSSFWAESKYVSKINKFFQFFKLHAHVAKNITHERSHSDLPGSNCESSSGWFFLCSDIIAFEFIKSKFIMKGPI